MSDDKKVVSPLVRCIGILNSTNYKNVDDVQAGDYYITVRDLDIAIDVSRTKTSKFTISTLSWLMWDGEFWVVIYDKDIKDAVLHKSYYK
jgi:hypothetical protein